MEFEKDYNNFEISLGKDWNASGLNNKDTDTDVRIVMKNFIDRIQRPVKLIKTQDQGGKKVFDYYVCRFDDSFIVLVRAIIKFHSIPPCSIDQIKCVYLYTSAMIKMRVRASAHIYVYSIYFRIGGTRHWIQIKICN